jgi:adenylate kinase family enzyme
MTKQDILKCIALLEKQKAENLSKQVSDDAEIQAIFLKMLLQDDKQEQLRKRYDRIYTKNHPKYQLYQDAIFKFYDILEEQAKKLLNEALSLHEVMLG